MDSYELKRRFTFGVDSSNGVGKAVSFLNDENIVYLSGGDVIVQNLDTNKQHHIHGNTTTTTNGHEQNYRTLGIDAYANVLVSIEESRNGPYIPYISISRDFGNNSDNLKRFQIDLDEQFISEKQLCARQKVVPICIHSETLLIASILQISSDRCSLFCWNYENGLLLNMDKLEGYPENTNLGNDENIDISFHNRDNVICIQSSKCFWLYRIVPDTPKGDKWSTRLIKFTTTNSEETIGNLTCHCWMKDLETSIIFGTTKGNILVTNEGTVISSINDVGFPIKSLLNFNSGFIVGGPDSVCQVYEAKIKGVSENTDASDFICKSAFLIGEEISSTIKEDVNLESIAISPSLDKMGVFLSVVNEIFVLDLKQSTEVNADSFVQVACGSGCIHSIAACVQKSIILTGGSDGTVRCWDYAKGKQQFCKYFTDSPIAVSLHQSGLHAIVSFTHEVRCVHILIDDLKTFWRKRMQRKLAVGSAFSNGCHTFAIAHDVSIEIYDFFTGKLTNEMKGYHKITQLHWRQGDGEIISMDESGMLRRWDIYRGTVLAETSQFKVYTTNTYFNLISREALWMVSDGRIHVLSQQSFEVQDIGLTFEEHYLANWCPSLVATNHDSSIVLILSNESSNRNARITTTLRLCKLPFSGYADFVQRCDIKCVCVHEDFIFCASKQNLYFMQLREKSKINKTLITQISLGMERLSDRFSHNLVSEMHMEERNTIVNDLTSVLSELKTDHEYKVNLIRMKNEDEIFNLEENLREAIFNQKDESESASNEKKRIIKRFEEEMDSFLHRHKQQIMDMENHYRSKIQSTFDKHKVEIDSLKQALDCFVAKKQGMITDNENSLNQMQKTENKLLSERQSMTKLLREDVNALRLELVERRDQVEDDIDTFIANQKRHHEERLVSERQATLKVAGENGILNKRTHALIQNIEDQKEAIKHLLFKEETEKDDIKLLENSISHLLAIKKERKKTYASKEKIMSRMKVKKEELSKFRILDDKLHELKQSLENDITLPTLKKKMDEKERLLAIYESEHTNIKKLLAFRHHEIREKNMSLSKESAKYVGLEGRLSTLRKDLYYFTELLNKPDILQKKLRERGCDEIERSDTYRSKFERGNGESVSEDLIEELKAETKELTTLLLEQRMEDSEDLSSLRTQNHVLLRSIRETRKENNKAKKRLSKLRL